MGLGNYYDAKLVRQQVESFIILKWGTCTVLPNSKSGMITMFFNGILNVIANISRCGFTQYGEFMT